MSTAPPILTDRFGRRVSYIRISLTDRCDFRCIYCMSETMEFLPRAQILTLEEIFAVCRAFVELGVDKIRITGGEPLIRNGALDLIRNIGKLHGLRELALTTNGSRLAKTASTLKTAGVKRLNISLDSLQPERLREMTRFGNLESILQGIEVALTEGFEKIKLNTVVLKNRNHTETSDLVAYAVAKGLDISFIEEMPLGIIQGHDRAEEYYPSDAIQQDLEQHFNLLPTPETTGGPSRYWRVAGTQTRVGFISPHSHNFCGTCNRVRVTTEGRLLLCLGNEHSIDLKRILRANPGDDGKLKKAIVEAMNLKPERHGFDLKAEPLIFRHMNVTGG